MFYNVLIADDYLMIRQVFEGAVAMSDKYNLAASVPSASMAVEYCAEQRVDLILMDVLFPGGMSGLDAARKIKSASPDTKIILVTSMPEVTYIRQAKEIGIDSFWHKEVQEQPILEIMDRTMQGEHIYPNSQSVIPFGNTVSTEFTEREFTILKELVNGHSNREIADSLGIAEKTVKNNITQMLQKTGFRTRLELAIRARDIGLVIGDTVKMKKE